jgi:hypothetical protein
MFRLGYVGLSAALAIPAVAPQPVTIPNLVFAPPRCAYAVSFPWQPTVSQSTALDGGTNMAADLVRGSVRFSAACIATATGQPVQPLRPSEASLRMAQMARALGVKDATIHPLAKLGANCGQVEGTLGDGAAPYRIASRICIAAGSTFIAETIARAGAEDDTARKFLESVVSK